MGMVCCWVLKSSKCDREQRVEKDKEEEEREQKVTYIVCGYDREEKQETIKDKKNNTVRSKKIYDKRGREPSVRSSSLLLVVRLFSTSVSCF